MIDRERALQIVQAAALSSRRFRALQLFFIACGKARKGTKQYLATEAALRELADDAALHEWLAEEGEGGEEP
jgi:hypothetical protein